MFSSLFSKVFSPVEASLAAADVASEETASLDAAALEDAALPQPARQVAAIAVASIMLIAFFMVFLLKIIPSLFGMRLICRSLIALLLYRASRI